MDQTLFSRARTMDTATILEKFPASDAGEIARLLGRPARLTAYLAETNDLTRGEANEVLALLGSATASNAQESALKAA